MPKVQNAVTQVQAADKVSVHMHGWILSHLSGSRSTMPITMIFLPGRMPPRMRPLKGTVYAEHIVIYYAQPWGENTSVHLK